MDDLLLRQRISVSDQGDQVTLTVGNQAISFDYETALKLSTWLRHHGKRAKATAGDISRHWHVIAELSDAEANDKSGRNKIIP